MFMKDIGDSKYVSDCLLTMTVWLTYLCSWVNPVEIVYASFPFFLFINSTYAGQLLSPLLEFQDTPYYNQAYAARDIGERII